MEDEYVNYNSLDGHSWFITILFSDGTQKEMRGSNRFPITWAYMDTAFKKLTGENVLLEWR